MEAVKVVTTARALILDVSGRILLVRNRNGICWYTPGGWLDGFETMAECCAREVYEELGLTITVDRMTYIVEHRTPRERNPFDENLNKIEHFFSCKVISGKIDETTDENKWQDIDNGHVQHVKFFSKQDLLTSEIPIAPHWLPKRDLIKDATKECVEYFPWSH